MVSTGKLNEPKEHTCTEVNLCIELSGNDFVVLCPVSTIL